MEDIRFSLRRPEEEPRNFSSGRGPTEPSQACPDLGLRSLGVTSSLLQPSHFCPSTQYTKPLKPCPAPSSLCPQGSTVNQLPCTLGSHGQSRGSCLGTPLSQEPWGMCIWALLASVSFVTMTFPPITGLPHLPGRCQTLCPPQPWPLPNAPSPFLCAPAPR